MASRSNSAGVRGELEGFEELERQLARFGPVVEDREAERATRRGAEVVRRAAAWNAAAGEDATGQLSKSIAARIERNGARVVAYVAAKLPMGAHGHLVEFGTAEHRITHKRPHRRTVTHPGSKPRPWLRPAWDTSHGLAAAEMRKSLQRAIRRLAKRYGGSR